MNPNPTPPEVIRPRGQAYVFPDLHTYRFTRTEAEIGRLLCDGFSDQAISERRQRSLITVRLHIRMLRMKLRVTTRTELIAALRQKFSV